MKIYLAQINTTVGDLAGNANKVLREFKKAEEQGCDLAIFPEMTISGYPAQDLWRKKYFVRAANEEVARLMSETRHSNCAMLVGCPAFGNNRAKQEIISNAAYLIEKGEIKRVIRKKTLPNYGVFDEKRYFEPESALSFVEFRGQTLAILICEDIWNLQNIYLLQEQVLDCVIAMNASPYSARKVELREELAQKYVQVLKKPLVYLNLIGGQDSLVFDGTSFVMSEKSEIVLRLKEFEEDGQLIELEKGSVGAGSKPIRFSQHEATGFETSYYNACILGLRDYIHKNGFSKVMLGMSGGIDSALVAVMAVDALGPENVALYALPTKFNAQSSMIDAQECAKKISCDLQVISIENIFEEMLGVAKPFMRGVEGAISLAKENMQSRIRGNILMALSNASGALLLSTGNKSELATGYATIYGDMCGAFNPLKDIYKTQVYELAKWRNVNIPSTSLYKETDLIPQNILTKAPSAELRENQKDSDSLPDYDVLDKILFSLIDEEKSVHETNAQGFDEVLVKKVAKLIQQSEYKRHQAVIGPKLSQMSFDKDRRYSITNKFCK